MLVHKTAIPINEVVNCLPVRVSASVKYEGYWLVGDSARHGIDLHHCVILKSSFTVRSPSPIQ